MPKGLFLCYPIVYCMFLNSMFYEWIDSTNDGNVMEVVPEVHRDLNDSLWEHFLCAKRRWIPSWNACWRDVTREFPVGHECYQVPALWRNRIYGNILGQSACSCKVKSSLLKCEVWVTSAMQQSMGGSWDQQQHLEMIWRLWSWNWLRPCPQKAEQPMILHKALSEQGGSSNRKLWNCGE